MALLTNLIAPNFSRFDFVSNIYNYNVNSQKVLRTLDSFGCKIQTAHFNVTSTLRAYTECSLPINSPDSVTAAISDLVKLMVNDTICADLSCFKGIIPASNPIESWAKTKMKAEAERLEYLRWFGDKTASDPMDGYITMIKASATVQTIPSMSSALITSPTTVIAELQKVYAAAYPLVGSSLSIIISPAVWAALIQAVSNTPNNVMFTITGEGEGTFLGVKIYSIDALAKGANASAGIALAGVFGDRADAQLIFYNDASDNAADPARLTFELEELPLPYRNTYNMYGVLNVLPMIVNEDKLVAYY